MNLLILLLYIVPLLALIAASAFFSGSETALFSLGDATLNRWRKSGTRLQKLAARLMTDHHGTLIAILLGNNFVNILLAMASSRLTDKWLGASFGPVVAGLVVTALILVFGEVTPKTIAYNLAPTLAPRIATPIHWCREIFVRMRLISMLRFMSNYLLRHLSKQKGPPAVSAEEYETFVRIGRDLGVFGKDEADMLEHVLRLREIAASQAMRPRVDVKTVEIGLDEFELLAQVRAQRHRLLPVVDGDLDKVVGVLQVKAFMLGSAAVRSDWRQTCMRDPLFIPELSPLTKVLELMRQTQRRMSFVVDEYGGVEGILTLEDIFEEIVGEMEDEFDKPEWHLTKLGERHWQLSGMLPVHQLDHDLPIDLPETIADTVSGLIIQQLDDLPAPGDVWEHNHWRFKVRHVHRHRILDLDLFDLRPEDGTSADDAAPEVEG